MSHFRLAQTFIMHREMWISQNCHAHNCRAVQKNETHPHTTAVVVGDLSQEQMVIPKKEDESPKGRTRQHIRDRLVYNVWGLYSFVQMLTYKCLRFEKALSNQHISYILKGSKGCSENSRISGQRHPGTLRNPRPARASSVYAGTGRSNCPRTWWACSD